MLISAPACALPVFSTIQSRTVVSGGVILGLIANFGTLPFDDRIRRQETKPSPAKAGDV